MELERRCLDFEELPDAERSQWEMTNALKDLSARWREALNAEKLTG